MADLPKPPRINVHEVARLYSRFDSETERFLAAVRHAARREAALELANLWLEFGGNAKTREGILLAAVHLEPSLKQDIE